MPFRPFQPSALRSAVFRAFSPALLAAIALLPAQSGSAQEKPADPVPNRAGPVTPATPSTPPAGSDAPLVPAMPPAQPDVPGTTEPAIVNGWHYIVIHHSASPSGNAAIFDRLHRGKGWDGVAYHFVITNGHGGPDGGLQITPRWWHQKHGAHAGKLPYAASSEERNCYNEFGIGICVVGNFEHQAPTPAQLATLTKLVSHLRLKYDILPENILGHGHVKSTACPGSHFPWSALFAKLELPSPTHLFRHTATGTLERCPWCLKHEGLTASRNVAPHGPAGVLPPRNLLLPTDTGTAP